jgi:FtsZ-interacting cell division protein YlmF
VHCIWNLTLRISRHHTSPMKAAKKEEPKTIIQSPIVSPKKNPPTSSLFDQKLSQANRILKQKQRQRSVKPALPKKEPLPPASPVKKNESLDASLLAAETKFKEEHEIEIAKFREQFENDLREKEVTLRGREYKAKIIQREYRKFANRKKLHIQLINEKAKIVQLTFKFTLTF